MRHSVIGRAAVLGILLMTLGLVEGSGSRPAPQPGECDPFSGECDHPSCPSCPSPPGGYCLATIVCCEIDDYYAWYCLDCWEWSWTGQAIVARLEWWEDHGKGCNEPCGEYEYWKCL